MRYMRLSGLYAEKNKFINMRIVLLIEIRKDAKARKDFATSDKIRNQLTAMGIQLKDEKDGSMSYTIA
jgi:cysteinyl-tRNA synthetase